LITFEQINLGVAMDTPTGLRVPVIREIETLELADIATQLTELSDKARDNRLTLSDMSQGTFTVSNLGMFNVTHFTPIVIPPQTAILGIGTIHQQVVVDEDDRVSSASMMSVSLTSDHRVVDGATAAKFLNALKSRVEAA
jgi:pyruvate dehydrogenase E2 component (dihydrolipoamide acetyltransferase)